MYLCKKISITTNWTSIFGEYELKKNELIFKGKMTKYSDGEVPAIGNFLSDEYFGGGKITCEINFKDNVYPTGCEIMIFYDPQTKNFVSVGIGGGGNLFSIRSFINKWDNIALVGEYSNLKINKDYKLEIEMKGSLISLKVDGINIIKHNLSYTLPQSQIGIWCQSSKNISIKNLSIKKENPKAFIVMQFSSPYNELYDSVIKKVCEKFKIDVVRADETFGPGLILSDIIKQINESRLIIADISIPNPNVFYEVGYSHALNKPTILIAENETKLPFDISPFRTLFYENSIIGKERIEIGLENHIKAVMSEIDWS